MGHSDSVRSIIGVILSLAVSHAHPGHAQDSLVQFSGHAETITQLAVPARGGILATAARDGTVRTWSLETGTERLRVRIPDGNATALGFVGDDRLLIAIPEALALISVADGSTLAAIRTGAAQVTSVRMLQGDTAFVAGQTDGTVALWDLASRRKLQSFEGLPAAVTALAVAPDGRAILAGGADGRVRLWPREPGSARIVRAEAGAGAVVGLGFVAGPRDGASLVSAHADGTVILWTDAGREMARFETGYPLHDMVVSPKEALVITVGGDGRSTLWSLPEGRAIRTFKAHDGVVRTAVFSPGGDTAVTGGDPRFAFAWDIPPPEERDAAAAETALALDEDAWRVVQTALIRAGLDIGVVDGLPGPRTRAGLARWQRMQGDDPTGYLTVTQLVRLSVSGIADPAVGGGGPGSEDAYRDTSPALERRLGPAAPGRCHLIVAARRTRTEAARFVNTLHKALKESFALATSENDWFVISAGVIPRREFEDLKKHLTDEAMIPSDSYCSRGTQLHDYNTDIPVFDFIVIE